MDGARMLGRSWGEGEGTPTSGRDAGMKEPGNFRSRAWLGDDCRNDGQPGDGQPKAARGFHVHPSLANEARYIAQADSLPGLPSLRRLPDLLFHPHRISIWSPSIINDGSQCFSM